MNTKKITDRAERKKVKRAARKKAAPKAKRASGVARGSLKKKDQEDGAGPAQALALRTRCGVPPMNQLLRTKSIDALIAGSEEPAVRLRKTLGLWSLMAFGIGAVIGSGIFIVTGTAAAGEHFLGKSVFNAPGARPAAERRQRRHAHRAAPALVRPSRCRSSWWPSPAASPALCYAELASMIPIAGSAYTYAYATLGEIFAWIIGWDLILEYAVLQHGGGGRVFRLLQRYPRQPVRHSPAGTAFAAHDRRRAIHRSWFNVPALLILLVLSYLLVRGVRESAETNNIMVVDQDRRHSDVRVRRGPRGQHRELASVHAQRILRAC